MKKILFCLQAFLLFISGFALIKINANGELQRNDYKIIKEYLYEMDMKNFNIISKETLYDFNNNLYNLYNFFPKGYAIFDVNTEEFIEGSFERGSPYENLLDHCEEKFYMGPSNYYIMKENKLLDISRGHFFEYSTTLKTMSEELNNKIHNYSVGKKRLAFNLQETGLDNNVNVTDNGWFLIKDHNYFRKLDYFPTNYDGSCGFVALSMLLGYLDTYDNDNIVPSNFITKSLDLNHSPGTNNTLKNLLVDYGLHFGILPGDEKPAPALFIKHTFLKYKEDYLPENIQDKFLISMKDNFVFKIKDINDIRNLILQDLPVIIVMKSYNFSSISDPLNSNDGFWHTVLTYGYKNDRLLAHFGLGENSECIINSALITGFLSIEYTGSHVHSRNYTIDNVNYCGCEICNCRYRYSVYSPTQHRKYCTMCSFSIKENHNWLFEPTGRVYCRTCGYVSSVTPFNCKNYEKSTL